MTDTGIRLAIQHLPNLKTFDCKDSVKALSEIFREKLTVQPVAHHESSSQQPGSLSIFSPALRPFSLTNLRCKTSYVSGPPLYTSGELANAVELCPFVVHVEIDLYENADFKDVDLEDRWSI